jgi:hypothetical protein
MQQNIGMLDRYLRLMCGLVVFGAGVQMKRRSSFAKGAMLTFGAMKIAEGVTGWCPIMYACGVKTNQQEGSTAQHLGGQTLGGQARFFSEHSINSRHHVRLGNRHLHPHARHANGQNRQHGEPRREMRAESDSNLSKSAEHAINESFGTLGIDNRENVIGMTT